MLPVLDARESITAANRHAVGSGVLEKQSRDSVTRAWSEAAGISRSAPRATPDQLALMGIGIVKVPPKAADV
jgi:hypothetical protein